MTNPPPVPLLYSLANNSQQKRDVQALRMFLLLLWEKAGGGSDPLSDLEDSTLLGGGGFAFPLAEGPCTSSISSNYTCLEDWDEFIEVTASCTITLPANANDLVSKTIFHNAGYSQVTVTDGTGSDILFVPETVMSYRFLTDLGQWVRGL